MSAERQAPFVPPPPRTGGCVGHLLVWPTVAAVIAVWATAFAGPWVEDLPAGAVLGLTVLPWIAGSLAVWTFFLWLVLPDHRAAPWALLGAVLGPIVQWGPAWADRGVPPGDDDLVAVTWNVRRLWGGPSDAGEPTTCVADTLAAIGPDLVVLQEVTRPDLDRLGERLELDCVHTTYRDVDRVTGAGIAVCTRGATWELKAGSSLRFETASDWHYMAATLEGRGRTLHVLGVHLHPYKVLHDPVNALQSVPEAAPVVTRAQLSQAHALLREIQLLPEPTILAGDFNSTRDTPLHAHLRTALVDMWERGAVGMAGTVRLLDLLPLRIDYLYADPDLLVVDAQIPDPGCSDHRPVVGVLRVPAL